jgi:hypothetical protein
MNPKNTLPEVFTLRHVCVVAIVACAILVGIAMTGCRHSKVKPVHPEANSYAENRALI